MYNFSACKAALKDVEEWLAKEYTFIHTGRATPAVLDGLRVESYGDRQPIKNLATVSVQDARTLLVSPWDKGLLKAIEKAITTSDLGLSAATGDSGIRVSFPELSGERRQSLAKVVKEKMEEARISVRKERESAWNDIQEQEKNDEIGEDEKFGLKDELQKLVDETNKRLEALAEEKTKNILE
ncbi:MAG: ribosome recycling factor [Candidatus Yonathbacteria bacterium]|nr:ribosome recycling factor [Candidatus Yonathbacteria bacterium]